MDKKERIEKGLDLKSNLTIPNFISVIRLVLIAPFMITFINENYIAAAIIVVASGLSDCVDGFIARKFNQMSELGKIIDPLADKLTLIAVSICIIIIEPYVLAFMIVLFLKDFIMMLGGTYLLKNGIVPPKSKWYGKLGTVLFYLSAVIIVVLEIIEKDNFIVTIVLLSVTSAVMIFALIKYFQIFLKIFKEHKAQFSAKKGV